MKNQTVFRFLILLLISLQFPSSCRIVALGLSFLILLPLVRTKEYLFCTLCFLCCLFLSRPVVYHPATELQGTVEKLYSSGFVLRTGQGNYVVRSKDRPFLDDRVLVRGSCEPVTGTLSFYGFDSEKWAYQNRYTGRFEAEHLTVVRTGRSMRHFVDQKIRTLDDPEIRALSAKMLLGINDPSSSWDLLYRCGFQYSLLLRLITLVAGWFVVKENLGWYRLAALVFLTLFTHGSYPVVRLLIGECCQKTGTDRNERWLLKWLILVSLAPFKVSSPSFLFPFCFSLIQFLYPGQRDPLRTLLISGLLQSALFHEVSLFILLGGSLFRFAVLFGMLGCLAGLFFPACFTPVRALLNLFERVSTGLGVWYGQISAVLVLLVLISCCFSEKYRTRILLGLCTLVTVCGLWHPLASLTLINVGQGDSILIRLPYNRKNILVDTGRPSAYPNVRAMLQGEGIRKLDALIITHDDEDHCGNVEALKRDFHPDQVIERVSGKIEVGDFILYNFNRDSGRVDSNPGSMVLLLKLDDLSVILSGDAPISVEEDIVRRYPQLRVDILKIGHHGSATSSCEEYLTTLRPSLALNSSGVNNRYRHPHPEVVRRLASLHIPLIDTQKQGDIRIIVTRFFKYLFTAGRGFVIIR